MTVARLNWLGRNTPYIMQLVAYFSTQGVRFVSLDLGIDTDMPAGRLVLGIFTMLAEYDREKSLGGIELAKAQDKYLGRRPGVDVIRLAKVKSYLEASMSVHQVVAATGVGETSAKRYCKLLVIK